MTLPTAWKLFNDNYSLAIAEWERDNEMLYKNPLPVRLIPNTSGAPSHYGATVSLTGDSSPLLLGYNIATNTLSTPSSYTNPYSYLSARDTYVSPLYGHGITTNTREIPHLATEAHSHYGATVPLTGDSSPLLLGYNIATNTLSTPSSYTNLYSYLSARDTYVSPLYGHGITTNTSEIPHLATEAHSHYGATVTLTGGGSPLLLGYNIATNTLSTPSSYTNPYSYLSARDTYVSPLYGHCITTNTSDITHVATSGCRITYRR